jgi:hypothetical protein
MRPLALSFALALAILAPAGADEDSIVYLELWQPEAEATDGEPAEAPTAPSMLLAVDQPTVSAQVPGWCVGLRQATESSVLADILLRGRGYDHFATDSIPLRLEILIDDVEMRYALGTERPPGASGIDFPFFQLCPVGFGSRDEEGWALDVVHVMNHRGDSLALGLYKGILPAAERAYLASEVDYPLALPDPAGLLLMGSGREIDMLLLVAAPDATAFNALRQRIVR